MIGQLHITEIVMIVLFAAIASGIAYRMMVSGISSSSIPLMAMQESERGVACRMVGIASIGNPPVPFEVAAHAALSGNQVFSMSKEYLSQVVEEFTGSGECIIYVDGREITWK